MTTEIQCQLETNACRRLTFEKCKHGCSGQSQESNSRGAGITNQLLRNCSNTRLNAVPLIQNQYE